MEIVKNNHHHTKCMCGKGEFEFWNDQYNANIRRIRCPECAKKYHVTADGIYPRHIPLRYKHGKIYQEIRMAKLFIRDTAPQYNAHQMSAMLTVAEYQIVFGCKHNASITLWYPPLWNDKAHYLVQIVNCGSAMVWKYSREEIEAFIRDIEASQTLPDDKQIFFFCQVHGLDNTATMMKRAVLYYSQHAALQREQKSTNAYYTAKLKTLAPQYEAECRAVDEQRAKALIPWDRLQPIFPTQSCV